MTDETKRGSKGGAARAEKLTKEQRSAIAKAAAEKRWAKKKEKTITEVTVENGPNGTSAAVTFSDGEIAPLDLNSPALEVGSIPVENANEEKHCAACLAGQSLEEGDGEHILGTVEHPVTLPAAFDDSKMQEVTQTPPAPPVKPIKAKSKNLPKEFKSASSYAEKRLPQAIKEKSEHVAKVAQLDAEINDLVRVIKALGGSVDPQVSGQPYQMQPYAPQPSVLPPVYPEYHPQPVQAAAVQNGGQMPVVTPQRPMKMGGAGALDFTGIMND